MLNDFQRWELELAAERGVFSALCMMDALDLMGADAFVPWFTREGREDGYR